MKKIFTIILLLTVAIHCRAQDPDWLWAKSGGGSSYDSPKSMCTDLAGNVYAIGYFQSPSIAFGSNVLINNGFENTFFVKYDMNGNVLWAKSFGARGYSCAADAYGFVYLLGLFGDSLIVGTDTLVSFSNFFLAKFDTSGNGLWARTADSGYVAAAVNAGPNGLCVDSSGNIFFTGAYLDSTSIGGNVLIGQGRDMLLAKYDSTGNVLWVRSAGGTSDDEIGAACTSDVYGNVFVTGWFYNQYMYIGTDTLINSASGTPEIFLAKYDSSGNFLWAESAGGNDGDGPTSIASDSSGNVFISGDFVSASASFGSYTLFNSAPSLDHTFLAKYDSSGNVLWAHAPVGSYDKAFGIASDRNGNIYMAGSFVSNQITFGTITLSRVSNFDSDLYVVKYDANGNAIWAKRAGNTSFNEPAFAIAVDIYSDIYVCGEFTDTVTLSFGSSNLTNNGLSDVFLAKLTHAVGVEENLFSAELTVYPNPCSGHATIVSSRTIDEIKITDMTGRLIEVIKPKERFSPLYLTYSGIYLVSVKSGSGVVTKKLVVNY